MRLRTLRILASSLALAALGCAGCNIIGAAVMVAHGPEKMKKLHDLDQERSTVLFIDDRQSHIPRRSLRIAVAETAEKTLLKRAKLDDMISYQSALMAAVQDTPDKPLSIADLGRAVGAEVVIYATVDQFTLAQTGDNLIPTAQVRIKVVDVAANTRAWPEQDSSGYPLVIRQQMERGGATNDASHVARAEMELAKKLGTGIAQIFFTHERFETVLR